LRKTSNGALQENILENGGEPCDLIRASSPSWALTVRKAPGSFIHVTARSKLTIQNRFPMQLGVGFLTHLEDRMSLRIIMEPLHALFGQNRDDPFVER